MDKLTGQCKIDFEKWLLVWIDKNIAWETETPDQYDINHFYKFPLAMQFGVIQEFGDNKGIRISIIDKWPEFHVGFSLFDGDLIMYNKAFNSRSEARTAAIEKFNQIYNKE